MHKGKSMESGLLIMAMKLQVLDMNDYMKFEDLL